MENENDYKITAETLAKEVEGFSNKDLIDLYVTAMLNWNAVLDELESALKEIERLQASTSA